MSSQRMRFTEERELSMFFGLQVNKLLRFEADDLRLTLYLKARTRRITVVALDRLLPEGQKRRPGYSRQISMKYPTGLFESFSSFSDANYPRSARGYFVNRDENGRFRFFNDLYFEVSLAEMVSIENTILDVSRDERSVT